MTFFVGVCSLFSCPTETRWYDHFVWKFGTHRCTRSWRRNRRAAHEVLTKVVVRDYQPIYRKEAILLAVAMLENPDALYKHLQRSSASATFSILYDSPALENEHDKTLTGIHTFIDRLSAASAPGAHLVDVFPWMVYIPERYEPLSFIKHSPFG